jgi:hypothetical protein
MAEQNSLFKTGGNSHEINCLFYIKGSKDYPIGQQINANYGYDTNDSETPIYETSIAEVYSMRPNLVEVFNDYSGLSDINNGISKDNVEQYNLFENDTNNRANQNPEFISTMLIDSSNADEKEFIKNFIPNYQLPSGTFVGGNAPTYAQYISDINEALKTDENNIRYRIFCQQVFSFIERIKHDEAEILEKLGESHSQPTFFEDNKFNNNGTGLLNGSIQSTTASDMIATLENANVLEKWLMLTFPGSPTDSANNNNWFYFRDNLPFNPFRTDFLFGSSDDAPNIGTAYNNDLLDIPLGTNQKLNKILFDQLAGIPWYNDSNRIKGINIRYKKGSASLSFTSDNSRISKISFALSYDIYDPENQYYSQNASAITNDTFTFNIYFDPSKFVSEETDASKFKVWTYNDNDFDNDLREAEGGPSFVYPTSLETFGKYDNDYGNVLLPPSDNVGSIRNHFIASEKEITNQFINELKDNLRGGGYDNYVEFKTTRVSPYIDDSGRIQWETEGDYNRISQVFYIFYKGQTPPTDNQQITAVRNYLKTLHKGVHCHPTRYDNNGKVITIGHGNSEDEVIEFLSHMYPNLFSQNVIYIIPAKYNHYNEHVGEEPYTNPQSYYSTTTPKRIIETLIEVDVLKNVVFHASGIVNSTAIVNEGIAYPIEVFNIGSFERTLPQNNPTWAYPMPWYAVSTSSDVENPLTSLNQMADYKPSFLLGSEISSQTSTLADKFQMIMIMLAKQMFINPGHTSGRTVNGVQSRTKALYTDIFGIKIEYSCDYLYDKNLKIDGYTYYNVASFTINSTKIIVYSQYNKDFGYTGSSEIVIDDNNVSQINL